MQSFPNELDHEWVKLHAIVPAISAHERDGCGGSRLDPANLAFERPNLISEPLKQAVVILNPRLDFATQGGVAFGLKHLPPRQILVT